MSRDQSDSVVIDMNSALALDPSQAMWMSGATVWCIGSNYKRIRDLKQRWQAHVQFAPMGDRLNATAIRYREDFIQIDKKLRLSRGNNLDWFSSNIAERCPYGTDLLLNACRLIVFKETIKKPGRHIFVVEDRAFARILYSAGRDTKAHVSWGQPNGKMGFGEFFDGLIDNVQVLYKGLRARMGGFVRVLKNLRVLRHLRNTEPLPYEALREVDVLIVTWARSKTFSSQSCTDEVPSLGTIPSVLRDAGLNVAYLSSALYWVESYAEIAKNSVSAKDPVMLLEDTYCISDVFRAVVASLFFQKCYCSSLEIGEHDLTGILSFERKKEWMSWRPAYARLFASIGQFCVRNDIKPKAILHLYENHSWERCLHAGFREHLPHTRIVGCQQSPFSRLYLNFMPSHRDVDKGEMADILLVPGSRFAKIMISQGVSESRVINVGSIRYRDYFDNQKITMPREKGQPLRIVAPTGTDISDGEEFVLKVAAAAAGIKGLEVVFNFHPLASPGLSDMLKRQVTSIEGSENVIFSDKPVQELLFTADCILYSDTTAAFEAVSIGLPVFFVGREAALDYNLIERGDGDGIRTIEDIRALLQQLLKQEVLANDRTEQYAILQESLGPVDEQGIINSLRVDVKFQSTVSTHD